MKMGKKSLQALLIVLCVAQMSLTMRYNQNSSSKRKQRQYEQRMKQLKKKKQRDNEISKTKALQKKREMKEMKGAPRFNHDPLRLFKTNIAVIYNGSAYYQSTFTSAAIPDWQKYKRVSLGFCMPGCEACYEELNQDVNVWSYKPSHNGASYDAK